jgi:uncharacterized protein (UPF0335 family)
MDELKADIREIKSDIKEIKTEVTSNRVGLDAHMMRTTLNEHRVATLEKFLLTLLSAILLAIIAKSFL